MNYSRSSNFEMSEKVQKDTVSDSETVSLVVRVAIQNFLKNAVISTVFGFRTTDFLACNFITNP